MPDEPQPTLGDDPRQGAFVNGDDEVVLAKAIDLAFDYRGDVTIRRRGVATPIDGYLFDRRGDGETPLVRIMTRETGAKVEIPYREIETLVFSGRDTAAGKSFETWMKKYVQKKLAGEAASLHPDEG